ncbi:MAG: VOC family protein [Actinobacteria bacterium]|nr:MAG: VOC family protein [Actinomycetota bacterium]
MSTVATTVGRFVWHEQVSSDPKQAQGFYTELFGWGTEVFKPGEIDYTMISTGGQSHGGFSKAMEGAPPPHWIGHVRVENVDETIEKAKSAGGKLAAGPFEMSEVGRIAIITDPQGAFISAYQPESDGPGSEGVFVWDELGTTDVDGAQRFYGEVFGWSTTDMGSEYGGYRIFQRGETRVGGLIALPDASMPAGWQPYVAVDDPDGTTAKANELGGSTLMEPMDVPNVGRIAVLRDPQGAVFGIIKPDPAS